ncbi:hypothetical protein GFS24_01180 [Chitinophaga sp. SYP-B3965]|uniref:hypothetical protein n=1 Tax=Chitinophaga sp. SYP-B3965 TaxID=2663120 RepID=UPI0012996AAE|nr:hypothetical protein [Chitinophaga sp. SYP-B3965]MRG43701.1 hypothetical protein [Chitinophaga sp. SYP-B3965]
MKRIAFVLSALYFVSCQQPVPTAETDKDSAQTVPDSSAATAVVIDTVTIGGQLYNITLATQGEYDQIPEWRSDTSEAVNILPDSARVRRAGDSLILTLANGQRKVMVNNNSDNDEYTQYAYQKYLPALQHWVVFNAGYEWHSYELIDSRTGEMTRTIGLPELSPDKKHFICTNTDLMAAFTLNGFQLFQLTPEGKPVLLQEQELHNWGATTIKWKDDKNLLALQHYLDPKSDEHTRYIRLSPRP